MAENNEGNKTPGRKKPLPHLRSRVRICLKGRPDWSALPLDTFGAAGVCGALDPSEDATSTVRRFIRGIVQQVPDRLPPDAQPQDRVPIDEATVNSLSQSEVSDFARQYLAACKPDEQNSKTALEDPIKELTAALMEARQRHRDALRPIAEDLQKKLKSAFDPTVVAAAVHTQKLFDEIARNARDATKLIQPESTVPDESEGIPTLADIASLESRESLLLKELNKKGDLQGEALGSMNTSLVRLIDATNAQAAKAAKVSTWVLVVAVLSLCIAAGGAVATYLQARQASAEASSASAAEIRALQQLHKDNARRPGQVNESGRTRRGHGAAPHQASKSSTTPDRGHQP